jgi:hypothetical protein
VAGLFYPPKTTSDMFSKIKRPPMEAALLFRAPGSKQKPAPRCAASLPLGIAQIDGVSLHPELDRSAKDQEGREVDRQYFKRRMAAPAMA